MTSPSSYGGVRTLLWRYGGVWMMVVLLLGRQIYQGGRRTTWQQAAEQEQRSLRQILHVRRSSSSSSTLPTPSPTPSQLLSNDWNVCRCPRFPEADLLPQPDDGLHHMDVWYPCTGPRYEAFGRDWQAQVPAWVRDGTKAATWGRRPAALPAGRNILALGNSHTRQMVQSLVCGSRSPVVSVDRFDIQAAFNAHMVTRIRLANHATLWLVANTYAAYSPQWQRLIQEQMGNTSDVHLANFDAVILGVLNSCGKYRKFAKVIADMAAQRPAADQVDGSVHYGPSVTALAAAYTGPVLFVPSMSVSERRREADLRQQVLVASQQQQPIDHNLTTTTTTPRVSTLAAPTARDYIPLLQNRECAAFPELNESDCYEGLDPKAATGHRCTGQLGGFFDLLAWDVTEWLYEHLG